MAGNEEQQEVRPLDDLKSKIGHLEDDATTPVKLQCPRVPGWLRPEVEGSEVSDGHHCEPKIISLGPYHHDKPLLKDGETLKLKLAVTYLHEFVGQSVEQPVGQSIEQSVKQRIDLIYGIIRGEIGELRKCYDKECTNKYSDEEFAVMMLVDGCALLCYILCVCLGCHDHEDFNSRYQDISLLHQDALLLENQLPYELLQKLMKMVELESEFANAFWTAIFQEFFGQNDESFFGDANDESFLQKMKNYCCCLFRPINGIISWKSKPKSTEKVSKPYHLLDLYRRNFLGDELSIPMATANEDSASVVLPMVLDDQVQSSNPRKVKEVKPFRDMEVMSSFKNVKELMAAGIRIKHSPTRHSRDISFRSNGITACLRIPPITIDNSTKAMFFNLIAYEMSSDVPHDFISYLRFLDSLIDHADDVKELQSIGILQNNLGTHEEVAEFFNRVSAKLESNFHAYQDVRVRIRKHFKNRYKKKLTMWITQCLDTYFSSPWTIIAWIGAALALFFTAVQTYFSVFHH